MIIGRGADGGPEGQANSMSRRALTIECLPGVGTRKSPGGGGVGLPDRDVPDPNMTQDADRLVRNMVAFITEGISPVSEAPPVPAEYWAKLQRTAEQRLTLAGYRIADLIIAAADNITTQRQYIGR